MTVQQTPLVVGVFFLVLAGCSEPAKQAPDAPGVVEPVAGLVYGCPGQDEAASGGPCFANWTLQPPYFGQPVAVVAHPTDPLRVAVLTETVVLLGPDAAPHTGILPIRTGLAVSHDGGATWTEHLVDHALDPENAVGALRFAAAAWTGSGRIVVTAYYEDTPFVEFGLSGGGGGSTGQSWIGWTDDEGATWTTAFLHRPGDGGAIADLDGTLVATWRGENDALTATWSLDDGTTWHEPVTGAPCSFTSKAVATVGGWLVGCHNPHGFDELKTLILQRIDPASGTVEGLGLVDTAPCASFGPVQAGDGGLVAVGGCESLHLNRSLDGGVSWEAFGDPASSGISSPNGRDIDGLAVGPDGSLTVVSYVSSPSDNPGCCDGSAQIATWSSDGRLLGNVVQLMFDASDPTLAKSYPWLLSRGGVAAGVDRTWVMRPPAPPAFGWLRLDADAGV